MSQLPDFTRLDTAARCAALWQKYPEKVVGLWAVGLPRQNVDVLWRLREELMALGVPVVFFFQENATPMLRKLVAEHPTTLEHMEDIYQLDDVKFFCLLSFVEVLVTSDYAIWYPDHQVPAKLVELYHNASQKIPSMTNYFYDYIVGNKNIIDTNFDYTIYPDQCKIHRKKSLSILEVSYPKLALILEERRKAAGVSSCPILLLYPMIMNNLISMQNIDIDKYVEIWGEAITAFLSWRPDGIVIFRPMTSDLLHPAVGQLRARFANNRHFFIDDGDDNIFWMARADYFVTDASAGSYNFSLTAKKPSIRMVYTPEAHEPRLDDFGWTISRPSQLVPLLEKSDEDGPAWAEALGTIQRREYPALDQSFSLLAGMIKRIFNGDDDPAWLKIDKGHTPCNTPGELLKLLSRMIRKNPFVVHWMNIWLRNVLQSLRLTPPQIWLLLLKRLFLAKSDAFIPFFDSPSIIAQAANTWLGNALETLPTVRCVGLVRHIMRKSPLTASTILLITATSTSLPGPAKKRALFLLLVESARFDEKALERVNKMAEGSPQYFSKPVLDKLNRFLPWAMKVPLPLRRAAAWVLGAKKPLARKYWQAHRALG